MAETILELLEEYSLVVKTADISPHTIAGNLSSLNQFRNWLKEIDGAPILMRDIKPKHLREWLYYRQTVQNVSKGTRRQNHIHLTKFFRWVKQEYPKELKKNPLKDIPKPVAKDPEIEFPDVALIDKVIANCEDDFLGRRDRLLLLLYKETGGRAREILALEESDIDVVEQSIFIRWGKGNKQREVPFSEETVKALIAYLEVRKDHRQASNKKLFIGRDKELKYNGLRLMFKRRSLDIGEEVMKPHGFRHALVHAAKEAGVSDDALMELMGWETPQMLFRYGKSRRRIRAKSEYRKKMLGKEE